MAALHHFSLLDGQTFFCLKYNDSNLYILLHYQITRSMTEGLESDSLTLALVIVLWLFGYSNSASLHPAKMGTGQLLLATIQHENPIRGEK